VPECALSLQDIEITSQDAYLGVHCDLLVGCGCQADVTGEIDFMPEPNQQSNR
jgi:hypothetical protein